MLKVSLAGSERVNLLKLVAGGEPLQKFCQSALCKDIVNGVVQGRCVASTVGDVGQKRVITRCCDLGSEP